MTADHTRSDNPSAAVLVIGDEILSGRTIDANLPHLARELGAVGIVVREARIVSDDEDEIIAALDALRGRYEYVFTTGGIGPTHDDITASAVARAFGVPLILHEEARQRLARRYPADELNEARLRMAHVPHGATLIDNPISAAPGFRIGNVHVLAGVPEIMKAMLAGVVAGLRQGRPVLSRTVRCDLPEGRVASALAAIQTMHPAISIGSYPSMRRDGPSLSLVLRGTDAVALERAAGDVEAMIIGQGGTPERQD